MEPPPPNFGVGFKVKQGGATFNKYYVWLAILNCAAGAALRPWTQFAALVICDKSYFVGIRVTSNPESRPPVLETRSVLWSLREVFDYYENLVDKGHPDFRELGFVIFQDERPPGVRMGVGSVVATPGPSGTKEQPGADMLEDLKPRYDFSNDNATFDTARLPAEVFAPALEVERVDLQIDFKQSGRPVCRDRDFYEVLLEAVIILGELDAEKPLGKGLSLYTEVDPPFTFQIGATSKGSAEEGDLIVNQTLLAIVQLATAMKEVPFDRRFNTFEAKIRLTSTGRVIGRINLFLGRAKEAVDVAA